MAEGLNRVYLLGNIGAKPELVTTGGGSLLKLRLATTEVRFDKERNRTEHTEWHSVVIWGKRADGLSRILGKGDRIAVEGSLETRSYDKNGEKRYSTQVKARGIYLCGGRGGGSSRAVQSPAPQQPPKQQSFDDDDIPF